MALFENDPLLTGRSRSIEELSKQNEYYAQRLQELQQAPMPHTGTRTSSTPLWDEIDKIVSSLNEQEKAMLGASKDYYDNSMAIQEMVNAEIIQMVKGKIEASQEGKAILEQQLALVRRTAKSAKEETARRDALFREYVTEHSDMTWADFIDMKNGKQKGKK